MTTIIITVTCRRTTTITERKGYRSPGTKVPADTSG